MYTSRFYTKYVYIYVNYCVCCDVGSEIFEGIGVTIEVW